MVNDTFLNIINIIKTVLIKVKIIKRVGFNR